VKPECRELAVLRTLGAAGALEGDEAARLATHLERCPACRAAEQADRELLDLARLPPPGPAEARATADLPARALAALRSRGRRRQTVLRLGAAAGVALAAAAAVLLLLGPALFRSGPPAVPEVAEAAAAWEVPDVDGLWAASAMLDGSDAAADAGEDTWGDDAMAAYDAGRE
jgi:anti-sigma factor RsiW